MTLCVSSSERCTSSPINLVNIPDSSSLIFNNIIVSIIQTDRLRIYFPSVRNYLPLSRFIGINFSFLSFFSFFFQGVCLGFFGIRYITNYIRACVWVSLEFDILLIILWLAFRKEEFEGGRGEGSRV